MESDVIVEMMAGDIVFSALTDSKEVRINMESIRKGVVNSVIDLGYTESRFQSDSVAR